MILFTHVVIALSSIIFASLLLAHPSKTKFTVNLGFIVATIATGSYLVATMHVNILSTCASGLGYLSVVAALSALAHRKLDRESAQ